MSSSQPDPRFYLFCNAVFGDWNTAEILIAQDPTIIEARGGTGETALHYLAIENELDGVKWLLERGADINTRDNHQKTPLIAAAFVGQIEMCRLLLERGADIFAMDHIGQSAISATVAVPPVDRAQLDMLLIHKGDADINLFFDDVDADSLLTLQGPKVARFWRNLGLHPRYEDFPPDAEDEEN